MGEAPQAGFNAADHNGRLRERLAQSLCIDDCGPVRPLAGKPPRRVGVVTARFLVARIVVHEGIHVPPCDTEEKHWFSELLETLDAVPVWLINHADSKPVFFEQTTYDGHAKTRMIDIRVARDEDDVAGFPTEGFHFLLSSRQKRRDSEALGPIGAARKQSAGRTFVQAGRGE